MIGNLLGTKAGYLHTAIFIVCSVVTIPWLFTMTLTEFLFFVLISQIIVGFLISGFQHRYCSHRSWNMPRWFEYLCVFVSAGFVMTPSIAWAAVHRQHHRYTDKEGDPHGHMHSVLDNFLVFNHIPPIRMIPKWMIRDKLYMFQARFYWEIVIAAFLLSVVTGMTMWWISFVSVSYFFQVTLNILGHNKNKQLVTKPIVSLFYAGELYHEYHHKNPMEPRFGLLDPPYQLFIRWLNNDTKRSKRNSANVGKTA